MPALQKLPAILPHFIPYLDSGTGRRAGAFSHAAPNPQLPSPACTPRPFDTLERLAHDTRNVLSSLLLYGNLLSTPGVLAPEHRHYAPELESMAQAATGLMEKILSLALSDPAPATSAPAPALPTAMPQSLPVKPVTDLAAELHQMQPLLAAIAGPAIKVSLAVMPCAGLTALAVEDLTRIMVNFIRNAADAMPSGGQIRITAQYSDGHSFLSSGDGASIAPPSGVLLTVSDNGPGIPAHLRAKVFKAGFTTRSLHDFPDASSPYRRGVGLSSVRQLVESAGGTVCLSSASQRGARFEVTLPLLQCGKEGVTSGMCSDQPDGILATDCTAKGHLKCL